MADDKNFPKQYQQGYTEFYKLRFKVTPDVLIPRPETELLVDEVIAYAKRSNHPEERYSDEGSNYSQLTIIDIGTGAGNIAISIAKNLSLYPKGGNVKIIAIDISEKALKVAKQNAKLHGVEDTIIFVQSDLLSSVILRPKAEESLANASLKQVKRSFANAQDDTLIIVTNLPYIPSGRIPFLDSSVKDFEPLIALDGGMDGFELYRKLFHQISKLHTGFGIEATNPVWQPKLIVCEIDYNHGELAIQEAKKYFPDAKVEIKLDLAHKQRILTILSS